MIFNRKQGLNTSRRGLCQNKNKSKRYVGFKNSNNITKMLFSWDMLKTLNNLLVEISVNLFVLSSVCKQKEFLHWSVHDLESLAGLSHDLAIWKKPLYLTDGKLSLFYFGSYQERPLWSFSQLYLLGGIIDLVDIFSRFLRWFIKVNM